MLAGLLFNGKCLEIVQDYRYLGIGINKKGSFIIAKDHLYKQGEKVMYSVLRKSRSLHLPIDLQIKLFDSLVLPILLYGSEIWGYENHENFENLQRKFCKLILNVSNKSSTNMVFGDLGRYPVEFFIKQRTLNYWGKLLLPRIIKSIKLCTN